jgi:D-serine deaminase-like pyridoxal phosphate-dependent protein
MDIVRPTLILNKTVCLRNIELMLNKAERHRLKFRPHFKSHQSIEIGRWFKSLGVSCITVSSVQMAEYFASDGWNDITIAFPFNQLELKQLNQLTESNRINILVDNSSVVEAIGSKLEHSTGVYIKISTGYNRAGISADSFEKIDYLLERIKQFPKLEFKGFLTHAGHTYYAKSKYEVQNIHFDAIQKMNNLKRIYKGHYPNLELSIGDTPSCSLSENFTGIDEIRPGNFVFYDLQQHENGACNIDDIALRMLCPVVSKQQSRNEIIVYGGAVHFSKDSIQNVDGKPLYGRVIIKNDNEQELLSNKSYIARLSQEHGMIRTTPRAFNLIKVGDVVEIIPVHACLTVHNMGRMVTSKGEEIIIMPRF